MPVSNSSTMNGWHYDRANARLDIYFRGTRLGHINASGLSTVGSEILDSVAQAAGLLANSITGSKLAAGALNVYLADGQDEATAAITVTGLATGDRISYALVLATKASIATVVKRAGTDFTVTTNTATVASGAVDNTNNQYVFFVLKA